MSTTQRKSLSHRMRSFLEMTLSDFRKEGWNKEEVVRLLNVKHGAFGTTCVVQHRKSGRIGLENVMLKENTICDYVKEQIKCLHTCRDIEQVSKMLAVSENADSYALYFESFTSLPFSMINANLMESWMLATIVSNIGKALRAIHKKGVIHRNITGDNILVSNALTVKITGFELATKSKEPRECVGTVGYLAPELISCHYRYIQMLSGQTFRKVAKKVSSVPPYSFKADYYSLGVTLFVSFFNQPPAFLNLDDVPEHYKEDILIFNMHDGFLKFPVSEKEQVSMPTLLVFKRVIRGLLRKKQKSRICGNSLKKHPAIKKANERPKELLTDLEWFLKTKEQKDLHPPQTVWYEPSLYFNHGDNPLDGFFYFASRPESYDKWADMLKYYYKEEYEDYKARQNQTTALSAPSLSQPPEEIILNEDNYLQEQETPEEVIEEEIHSHPSEEIPDEDNYNQEENTLEQGIEEDIHIGTPAENCDREADEIQQHADYPDDHSCPKHLEVLLESGHESDSSEEQEEIHRNDADVISPSETVIIPTYNDSSLMQSPQEQDTSISAPLTITPVVEDVFLLPSPQEPEISLSTDEENGFTRAILSIFFIVLCIIFLGKTVFDFVISSISEESDSNEDEDEEGHHMLSGSA